MKRIYFDNAATSWPKPESVYVAVDRAQREIGASAGRGSHASVAEASRLIGQTRTLVANLIHAADPNEIAFTFSGTDSLSTAIFGTLNAGDHVVTTVIEHNSVLRPLMDLQQRGIIDVTIVGCDEAGFVQANDIIDAVKSNTRVICLSHASNVTGSLQPIHSIKSSLTNSANPDVLLLIDAAQTLGSVPIDVQEIGCDMLAAAGHKSLLGPLGTGILYIDSKVVDQILPLRLSGTGTEGSIEFQPTKAPEKFESGNFNLPGIAGLRAGLEFLGTDEFQQLNERLGEHLALMINSMTAMENLTIQGPHENDRVAVVSLSLENFDCREASAVLDSTWGIQSRAGIHCAPFLHRTLGTEQSGGTLRFSPGLFTNREEVETLLNALSELAG